MNRTYVIPDLRFLIDFHWAISCLLGGRSSCRDDRSVNEARFGRGDGSRSAAVRVNGAIGSSCMQKPSSASSESTVAVADESSSASASPTTLPLPSTSDVRSSDNTNRLEFLRCCIMFTDVVTAAATVCGGSCHDYFVHAIKLLLKRKNDGNFTIYVSCTASISRPRSDKLCRTKWVYIKKKTPKYNVVVSMLVCPSLVACRFICRRYYDIIYYVIDRRSW